MAELHLLALATIPLRLPANHLLWADIYPPPPPPPPRAGPGPLGSLGGREPSTLFLL